MEFSLSLKQRIAIFAVIWLLGWVLILYTPAKEPAYTAFPGQNTPDQGKVSQEQYKQIEISIWAALPIIYMIVEYAFYFNSKKINWSLTEPGKKALGFLSSMKLPFLVLFLAIFVPTFFLYGVLVGAVTFPLLVVVLLKY